MGARHLLFVLLLSLGKLNSRKVLSRNTCNRRKVLSTIACNIVYESYYGYSHTIYTLLFYNITFHAKFIYIIFKYL